MALTREQFCEKLLRSYAPFYDIEEKGEEKRPLVATAFFHVHNAGYFLVKRAEAWAADQNEYIYVFSAPVLTKELFEECIAAACADGIPRIKPDKNHMSSFVDAVFICDEVTPEGLAALRRYRNKKSFHFSLHGWMEVYAAVVNLGKETVEANCPNAQAVKFLKNVLRGRRRGIVSSFLKK